MRLRPLLAALITGLWLTPIAAAAQPGLGLSGALLYTPKVALAPGALMVVQLQTLDGRPISSVRRPTDGAQVPLPFSIQGPANAPFGLRAALFVDGRAVWASGLIVIPPSHGAKVLPPVLLSRVEAASFAQHFQCGKTALSIAFVDGTARMQVRGRSFTLKADSTANGTRYVAGGSGATWFLGKGNAATVSIAGKTLPDCAPEIAPQVFPLRAGGTEPGWRLELAAGRMAFAPQHGPRIAAPLPVPVQLLDGLRFASPGDHLVATLTHKLCHDIATGLPYPLTAEVQAAGKPYRGCAGTPAGVLTGAPWTVTRAVSADLSGSGTEMTFLANQVSGKAPCNRFSARMMFGEGLHFGPIAATRNSCKAMTMTREQAFFNALGAADSFDIVGGELHLMVRGKVILVAKR